MKKHHIIYVPGLGDHWDGLRRKSLTLWQIFNVTTELVPMQWYHGSSYSQRADAIEAAVKAAKARGEHVTVIGESAGGSIATNMFVSLHEIDKLITLCGVVYPEALISPAIYAQGPAFKISMEKLSDSVNFLKRKKNVIVVTALYDPIVNHKHNRIDETKHVRMPSIGHFFTIVLSLTLFSPIMIYLAKKNN